MALDPDGTAREPWYSDRRWSRYAPLAGVLAVALWLIAAIVMETASNNPDGDSTPEEIAAYFNDNDGRIIVSGFVFMLGSALFLWFLGSLRERLMTAEGAAGRIPAIVFASGIVMAAMGMATVAPTIGGAFAAEEGGVDPGSAQAFWQIGDGFFVGGIAACFTFFLASGLAALRTRVLPAWLGWASLVLALATLIPWISWIVLIFGVPLWILVVAALLFMRPVGEVTATRAESRAVV